MVEEIDLIAQLKDSKTRDKAFESLVGSYKKRLYWHIRRIVLNHEDANDVLQNTFIKIYKNIESFNADSKIYTWMYRIGTNESLTFLRNKSKRMKISNAELQENMIQNLHADVYFDGDAIQLKLQKAIATLPEKQKLVFQMKYYDDLKYDEIAEILNLSVGGLKASYHLAVKKLEKFLSPD